MQLSAGVVSRVHLCPNQGGGLSSREDKRRWSWSVPTHICAPLETSWGSLPIPRAFAAAALCCSPPRNCIFSALEKESGEIKVSPRYLMNQAGELGSTEWRMGVPQNSALAPLQRGRVLSFTSRQMSLCSGQQCWGCSGHRPDTREPAWGKCKASNIFYISTKWREHLSHYFWDEMFACSCTLPGDELQPSGCDRGYFFLDCS